MTNRFNIKNETILSNGFYCLKNIDFDIEKSDGNLEAQTREVYHTANGVTILLYNQENKTIILTRQFRIATALNGNKSGMMIETCAGIVENESAEESVLREVEEETGYKLKAAKKVFELYSSPGATTEKLYYFIAAYKDADKKEEGGGLEEEQEDIEVIEMPFEQAYNMMQNGEITDAKTVQLLQYARLHLFLSDKVIEAL